jgi:hypothetical protein
MKSMKLVTSLFAFFLVASPCQADSDCRDADGNTIEQAQCANGADKSTGNASGLPEEALAQVNDLNAKMRYFKAIGFHTHSKEKRDEIEAIYDEYGVPLPDEYKE